MRGWDRNGGKAMRRKRRDPPRGVGGAGVRAFIAPTPFDWRTERGAASKTAPMGREAGSWMREVWSDAPRPSILPMAKHEGEVRDGDPVTTSGSKRLSGTDRMVSALSKAAPKPLSQGLDCSRKARPGSERDTPDEETNDWRAVCGR